MYTTLTLEYFTLMYTIKKYQNSNKMSMTKCHWSLLWGGGSCNFQPLIRGGTVNFEPRGRGGSLVLQPLISQMLRPTPPPSPCPYTYWPVPYKKFFQRAFLNNRGQLRKYWNGYLYSNKTYTKGYLFYQIGINLTLTIISTKGQGVMDLGAEPPII